jgi:hypothetical protein
MLSFFERSSRPPGICYSPRRRAKNGREADLREWDGSARKGDEYSCESLDLGNICGILSRALCGHFDGGQVVTEQRDGVDHASAAQSDFYEEMLADPTLLTLLRQRGNLDCGDLKYLVVAYGGFFQQPP